MIIIDEMDFMSQEDMDEAYKTIESRIGKLKKEGKLFICSTPPREK